MRRAFIPNWVLMGTLLFLSAFTGCQGRRSGGSEVLAEVNGRPVTALEVDKYYKQQVMEAPQKPTGEQEMMLRLNVLQGLVEQEILLQRAQKMGLMATDAEVTERLTELKSPFTEVEFQKQLQDRGLTADDLKDQIRREESIKKVVNKEITSRITITDAEIKEFYEQNRASFNVPETRVRLAQILVTPEPNAPVRNLKNDKARNDAQAKQKIEMLASRLKAGEDFAQLAQGYSEDPNSAANGGDFGYVPLSALDKADPVLKQALLIMQPGQTSGIIHSRQGYHIVKILAKEAGGQRQFSDPEVQQSIRSNLLNRKEQLLKAAYIDEARNQSKVVNYLARRVLEAGGKK